MSGWGRATRTKEPEEDGIELTTFKVWGRRLPGGDEEIDQDEQEQDEELVARIPSDFNTYRDAADTKFSPEELKRLYQMTTRMIEKARALKKQKEDAGEKVDLDAIVDQAFGDFPRGLIPPEFVKELQSWRRVRDTMTARAVVKGQAPEGQAAKIKGGLEKGKLATDLAKLGLKAMPGGEDVQKIVEHISEAMEYLGKVLEGAKLGIDGVQAKGQGDKPQIGPVEIKIADEKLMKALQGLGGLGADVMAKFLPVVGTLKNGADCLAAIKDTVERTKLRAGTGELRDQAMVDTTNQLSLAFDQAMGRETRLGVELGLKAATSGLSTAANVATSTVVGAKVGAALEVTSTVIKVGGTVVLSGYDEATARKAVATLKRAQAGDTDAQQLVFADNAHYAKMLIAVFAMDGNKLARTYLIDRGLEESDLDNPLTTADILFDYAVLKSGETEAPESKIDKALELLKAAKEKLVSFAELCETGLKRIGLMKDTPKPPEPIITLLPSLEQVRAMRTQINAAKQTQAEVAEQTGKPDAKLGAQILDVTERLAAAAVHFTQVEGATKRELERVTADLEKRKSSLSKKELEVLQERVKTLDAELQKWTELKEATEPSYG